MARVAIALLAAACIAGCASMIREQQNAALESAPVADWKRTAALALSLGANVVEVSERSPAFAFDTGKSFYEVLGLPAARPLKIALQSDLDTRGGGYFQPDFLVLDRDRQVVGRMEGPLAGRQPTHLGPFKYALSGEIVITDPPERAAFLLVRTTRELLRPGVPVSGEMYIPMGPTVASVPTQSRLPHRPMGTLRLEVSAQ